MANRGFQTSTSQLYPLKRAQRVDSQEFYQRQAKRFKKISEGNNNDYDRDNLSDDDEYDDDKPMYGLLEPIGGNLDHIDRKSFKSSFQQNDVLNLSLSSRNRNYTQDRYPNDFKIPLDNKLQRIKYIKFMDAHLPNKLFNINNTNNIFYFSEAVDDENNVHFYRCR